ncbi:MAG: ATP-binding protein [Myxococcales bacterium]|nr:ATP-binding protein [Myxococcales bacterium]
MTDRSFKATVPCDITFRDGIGTMLHAICHGANEKVMFEVVSAYNEAFNNVVHHSKLPDDAPVVVEVSRRGDELTIRIEDQGIGYEVDHNPDDDVIASLPDGDIPDSGMGLFIMSRCMDDVSYKRDGQARTARNELTMVRDLSRPAGSD